eukprot:c21002_g1_i1 orf=1-171(-)
MDTEANVLILLFFSSCQTLNMLPGVRCKWGRTFGIDSCYQFPSKQGTAWLVPWSTFG